MEPQNNFKYKDAQIKLKEYFNYEDFRKQQIPIIKSIIEKNENLLVIMPTGGGKSILYTIPALLYNGLTIVISPLIALMEDQVLQLKEHSIRAEYISYEKANFDKVRKNVKQIDILFISPERFVSENFLIWLKSINISLIALDEAHTFTEFGLRFRTDYRKLFEKLKLFKATQFIAVTATASSVIYEDLTKHYNFDNIFSYSVFRKNLNIDIKYFKSIEDRDNALYENLNQEDVSLIYTASRRRAERVYNLNQVRFNKLIYYHAKLPQEQKKEVLNGFLENHYKIIAATTAFGMGINKANVRNVHHIDFPLSIEDYTQQIGRAGRDGNKSNVILWVSLNEIKTKLIQIINADYYKTFNIIIKKIENNEDILECKEINILKLNKIIEEIDIAVDYKILNSEKHDLPLLNDLLELLKKENSEIKLTILSKNLNEDIWKIKDMLKYLQDYGYLNYGIKKYKLNIFNDKLLINIATKFKADEIKRIFEILEYIFTSNCRHGYLSNFFRTETIICETSCDNCKNKIEFVKIKNKNIDFIKLLSFHKLGNNKQKDVIIIKNKISSLLKDGYRFKIIDKKVYLVK